ncbi:septal ring lytic transglycosylase RlpA family protein [Hyphococcus luteus]|uniref:Endolytic peptidoglycan transglycosylase RlpA n=1 Tax=Hyphococcus luteus TaxID=2058213 RepID=A0A2S7K2F2_9PROT|nr:septal ring lytic transglycosylase RlpA family protein [Marinicaulis flavus]PQA86675.1 septal ring lytic transglycosylase RlpA family lipoprotein [Marinicaulis flavus]
MYPRAAIPAAFALFLLGAGCGREQMAVPTTPSLKPQCGVASYYHPTLEGNLTANGETYDPDRYTAAHKRLPFDTELEVRRRDTGETVEVRVNDRGPFIKGRIIDLSPTAASEIGLTEGDGVAEVCLVRIG